MVKFDGDDHGDYNNEGDTYLGSNSANFGSHESVTEHLGTTAQAGSILLLAAICAVEGQKGP